MLQSSLQDGQRSPRQLCPEVNEVLVSADVNSGIDFFKEGSMPFDLSMIHNIQYPYFS